MDFLPDGKITISMVVICCAVYFFFQRFQTKRDADKIEEDLKAWIKKVELDVSVMQTSLLDISKNVSYIRGRLEPKN